MKDKYSSTLQKKFRKKIWKNFIKGIKEYSLINNGDRILVCISGGKDSFLLAKCLEILQGIGEFDFSLEYLVMNPGYKEENILKIKENAKELDIPIKIVESDIFDVSNKLSPKKPCYICARMRRGFLYDQAKKLNCNKIALGHHFDDVIETTLLSLFYNGEFKTMMPKLHSTNFEGIDLIRPLYYVKEEDIIAYFKYHDLKFINCACKFTESSDYESSSKRLEIKNFIKKYKKINPNIDINVFKALEKVNTETILSYIEEGKEKSVLDKFDEN